MTPRRLKNIDAGDRAVRIRALTFALLVGAAMGGTGGGLLFGPAGALGGFILVSLAVYLGSLWIVEKADAVAQTVYNPSGDSTPYKQQYSYAASLAIRGRFQEAAAAYELHVIENPAEPQPYIELARLYRDKLKQYDDALAWFRRARTDAKLGPGQELYVIQEIIDLYVGHLKTPRKAIPELTLVCQRFPATPAARAAERQLAEMREMLAREREGVEPFTAQFLKQLDKSSAADAAREVLKELTGENPAPPSRG
jgi:tetratricopeptide (TPR) repeat protein